MPDLVVIVPSRGRPAAVAALDAAFRETCVADTRIVLALDADDPDRGGYFAVQGDPLTRVSAAYLQPATPESTMVSALNLAADDHARGFAVGFMGDDHRPRTKGWDQQYLDALRELGTGIVYGNDLLQGANLPTQVAMTADIVRRLGYMAPPQLRHMYVDNFWRDLGRAVGCIRYLPNVVVEHLHPIAGKAKWDPGYMRVNDPRVYESDAAAYAAFLAVEMPSAVATVKALR